MIFRAPEPPVSIPDVALTPFLLERAAGRGAKPFLVDGPSGRALTYDGWAKGVRRTAAGFARRGLRKGDVLAIYSHNVPEYAVAFHAVSLLGGTVTTVNPTYTASELEQQLRDSRARFLVTAAPCLDKASAVARDLGIEAPFVFGQAEGATPFDALACDDQPPAVEIDPRRDVVVMPYSSGTTGLPKGVMLTHRNLVANLAQSAGVLGVREDDTLLGVLPFFHIYGLTVIMSLALYVGATVIVMPRFELEACLGLMARHRVTYANVVPPIVLALAKDPRVDDHDLSSVRLVFSGAAPLSPELEEAVSRRLDCVVAQGYGLTETSPVTHCSRHHADGRRSRGIGPPIPNTEVKVVDVESGAELGPGADGEICVRGPQVMAGYLGRPDATAAMIDADGWLHTGDIGRAGDDGCFVIVDRLKELIKYKGLQVAPAELEAVLLQHPAVADAAVVPLADEEAGQVPKAFVVLKGAATPDELMAFVAERVAPYKRVRSLEVVEQIPKSPSGKILRRVLRDR